MPYVLLINLHVCAFLCYITNNNVMNVFASLASLFWSMCDFLCPEVELLAHGDCNIFNFVCFP